MMSTPESSKSVAAVARSEWGGGHAFHHLASVRRFPFAQRVGKPAQIFFQNGPHGPHGPRLHLFRKRRSHRRCKTPAVPTLNRVQHKVGWRFGQLIGQIRDIAYTKWPLRQLSAPLLPNTRLQQINAVGEHRYLGFLKCRALERIGPYQNRQMATPPKPITKEQSCASGSDRILHIGATLGRHSRAATTNRASPSAVWGQPPHTFHNSDRRSAAQRP